MINKIVNKNCLDGLFDLPDNSIDCCVTSPPYFGLRDYGNRDQIGLEQTPELFVQSLVKVFTEVRRVLKPKGTLWLNLGDSYSSSKNGNTNGLNGRVKQKYGVNECNIKRKICDRYKAKDLIGIPWMVAFALRSSGWYLRQDIIWNKPNPMPESVTDRCTKSHEYIFLMSKSARYYFDQDSIKTPFKDESVLRLLQNIENQNGSSRVPNKLNGNMKAVGKVYDKTMSVGGSKINGHNGNYTKDGKLIENGMANKKSVWTVTTKPFKDAHFATFPEDLIVDCIKAGCPEGGIVLDPFMGAGTTAVVAKKLNRNYIGFELNESYIKIANDRLYNQIGMFL